MRTVEPQVYLIAEPQIDETELTRYLEAVGADDWATDAPSNAEELIELGGRICYRSWAAGLNPNVSKVREGNEPYLANIKEQRHGSVTAHAHVTFIFHNVSRVFCYSEDTEVLTSEGWKAWPDVRGDEKFASLRDGKDLVYIEAEERFVGPYNGLMYNVSNEQVDLLVTPDHRMWIQLVDRRAYRRGEQPYEIALARDIAGKAVRYSKTANWDGEDVEVVRIPQTSREYAHHCGRDASRSYAGVDFNAQSFARFLGYFCAEGSLGSPDTGISLFQNAGAILEDMKSVLNHMRMTFGETCNGEYCKRLTFKCLPLYDWLEREVGRGAESKRIPQIVGTWSAELIREFLAAFVAGDGSTRKDCHHEVIYTTSKAVADELTVLALKAGWCANLRTDDRRGLIRTLESGVTFVNRKICYVVSLVKTRTKPHVNIHNRSEKQDRWVNYSGMVYCVRVPHGLLYVRRNGKPVWSGNTHELVRHSAGTDISQESLRYVRLDDIGFWMPPVIRDDPFAAAVFADHIREAERLQKMLAEHFKLDEPGTPFHKKKQITSAMRRIAPEGLATGLQWTCNFRALRHIIEQRTSPGAEDEIRLVFSKVAEIAQTRWPNMFGDYEVEIVDGLPHYKTRHSKI